jgi:hypothetical protein
MLICTAETFIKFYLAGLVTPFLVLFIYAIVRK